MGTILKMAWRNIWRNKRRTLITAASIFFAVIFSVFMNSIQKGAWTKMLDGVVNFYFGYAQIQEKDYWEDKSINQSFAMTKEISNLVDEIPELKELVPRIESFTLASHNNQTSGMLLVGVDPEKENSLTELGNRIVEGTYFGGDDKSVIIAEGVKDVLKLELGDTLILISQGYHGVNAAGKYPVKGIVHFASPELNKKMLYLPLKEAQYFYGAEGLLTSLALKIDDREDLEDVLGSLKSSLDTSQYAIMGWQEMMPELVEAQKTDAAGNYIFLLVLYLIISFGIFGTILMMTKEREYEFGVLISIGMKRRLLSMVVWLEVVFLGLFGAMMGILGSIPLVYYFKVNPLDFSQMGEEMMETYEKWGFTPIFPAAFEFSLFFWQAVIVVVITSILATYTFWKISRLKPVEAMRA
ncbi:MAG: ABC transporter permease [Bacteroidetes bacterium]|nr:ABC transporter permease [Bacteroidota bacterium]